MLKGWEDGRTRTKDFPEREISWLSDGRGLVRLFVDVDAAVVDGVIW